nr:Druantia anti-phage system protein DruA [Exiguobacterium sp. s193]
MEKNKVFKGNEINITNLIGDKNTLISSINELKNYDITYEREKISKEAIKPYIQLVTNERCELTGYKLREIWRYFRYTWSIPYKSTPGRNQFYIVRDAAQSYHPIIGIFALGNSVLHLTKRDNYIGWTLESIKESLSKKTKIIEYEEIKSGDFNIRNKVQYSKSLETEEEYNIRINTESKEILSLLTDFIESAIREISIEGLIDQNELENPTKEVVEKLNNITIELQKKQFNNKRSPNEKLDWKKESNSSLFKKKRSQELSRLLEAKMVYLKTKDLSDSETEIINRLVKYKNGKYINIALQANRKRKIGSNVMEIIVCGAIPPYNEILGGKLVSMLACSPLVVKQYNDKYSHHVSEIASRMKGEEVVRDSRLAYLGTTSLYQSGSSQYNRIKIPTKSGRIEYKKLGETEGFGSVFFSNQTSSFISKMLEELEGGRKINNVFGEGTSPRMRLMRNGLAALGISEEFTKHHTKRIVFGIELASNSLEFLQGKTEKLDYYMSLEDASVKTEEIIDFWKKRWFLKRIETVDIINRLNKFEKRSLKVSLFN